MVITIFALQLTQIRWKIRFAIIQFRVIFAHPRQHNCCVQWKFLYKKSRYQNSDENILYCLPNVNFDGKIVIVMDSLFY